MDIAFEYNNMPTFACKPTGDEKSSLTEKVFE
jgi:hypothetical protein